MPPVTAPPPEPAAAALVPAPADPGRWSHLVDLHSHVLPSLDDGARDPAEALLMLRLAEADGIQTVVATPHAASCAPAQVLAAVAQLNAAAAREGLAVRVAAGSEVRLAPDLVERYRAGRLITLNRTGYLLLELPLGGGWPPYLLEAIYALQVEGLVPVLAHAERYPAVQRNPGILLDLIARGVLVQLNATALADGADAAERRTARALLGARLAHIIASDAHDVLARPPRLRGALTAAAVIIGADETALLVRTAAAVLAGAPVTLPEPRPLPRRSLLERLRGW